MIIIGIAGGGTDSGKTTVVKNVMHSLSTKNEIEKPLGK
ncbi:hypothetical protein HMPREF9012_1526 [Bacteroidetes bacterium oral taxon 272 str. F0290]|nr:hypothetical protein HMPREF9012_1526 [Bacteroidetes bacterium oral taxon 272 str. F0290]